MDPADISIENNQGVNALLEAIRDQNIDQAIRLINDGVDLNQSILINNDYFSQGDPQDRYKAFNHPLNEACKLGLTQLVNAMIDSGAETNQGTLICATQSNSLTLLESLLQRGLVLGMNRALAVAVKENNTKACTLLLFYGANASGYVDEENTTCLMQALISKNLELTSLLLRHGANINGTDISGISPLMKMAMIGDDEAIKLLLDNGANIHQKSYSSTLKPRVQRISPHGHHRIGYHDQSFEPIDANYVITTEYLNVVQNPRILNKTAYELSLEFEHTSTAQLLKKYPPFFKLKVLVNTWSILQQATILVKNKQGESALIDAIFQGSDELAIALMDHDIDLNKIFYWPNNDGIQRMTALTAAAMKGNHPLVCLLLCKKADPNITYRKGWFDHVSPLNQAAIRGHTLIVETLLINNATPDDNTLHDTVKHQHLPVLEMLLNHGVNDCIHWALEPAFDHQDLKAFELLLKNGANPNEKPFLFFAVRDSQPQFARLLIQYGADVNRTNAHSTITALMMAAIHGDCELIDLLLNKGANIHHKGTGTIAINAHEPISISDLTALDLAQQANQSGAVNFLLQRGAATTDVMNASVQNFCLNQYSLNQNTAQTNFVHDGTINKRFKTS